MPFESKQASLRANAIAPDGSEVRILSSLPRGGLALFSLTPGKIARAVVHRSVEELWYVLAGRGRIWRKLGADQQILDLAPGLSLSIPTGASFQFRCDGSERLEILGVTMPPWPGSQEADLVDGVWPPAV